MVPPKEWIRAFYAYLDSKVLSRFPPHKRMRSSQLLSNIHFCTCSNSSTKSDTGTKCPNSNMPTTMYVSPNPNPLLASATVDFLSLPNEIRNITYQYAFCNTKLEIFKSDEGRRHCLVRNSSRPLLRACRQVRAEAKGYLYHDLSISASWALLPSIIAIQDAFRSHNYSFQSITNAFSYAHTLSVHGAYSPFSDIEEILPRCFDLRQLNVAFESDSIANMLSRDCYSATSDPYEILRRKNDITRGLELVVWSLKRRLQSMRPLTPEIVSMREILDPEDDRKVVVPRLELLTVGFRLDLHSKHAPQRRKRGFMPEWGVSSKSESLFVIWRKLLRAVRGYLSLKYVSL